MLKTIVLTCALFYCFSDHQDGVGEGGPYEGNDICVYHVETDFVMEDIVEVNNSDNKSGNKSKRKNRRKKGKQDEEDTINGRTNSWIWPVCLPKDDIDPDFLVDNGIVRQWNERGLIAGWLDAPPIDQTFSKILGSAVSEGDVFR